MHQTHSDTSEKIHCRPKRERETEREENKKTEKLAAKNYAVYKALIGYNRQLHVSSLLLFMCEKVVLLYMYVPNQIAPAYISAAIFNITKNTIE